MGLLVVVLRGLYFHQLLLQTKLLSLQSLLVSLALFLQLLLSSQLVLSFFLARVELMVVPFVALKRGCMLLLSLRGAGGSYATDAQSDHAMHDGSMLSGISAALQLDGKVALGSPNSKGVLICDDTSGAITSG